jgi:hypothetical protein
LPIRNKALVRERSRLSCGIYAEKAENDGK